MIKKIGYVLIFLLLAGLHSFSQYYSTGQEPFSVKWRQINTANFQLIFPIEYSKEANRIANILQSSIEHVGKSLNHKPKPISVVIHSNTASANGLVAWAPKRMELYPTIDIKPEPGEWLTHLAIHESRHVIQIDKLNQGVTKTLYYLFGEQATGLVLGLYIPLWFLEGDAVCTETALTESGRGRMPSFSQSLKPIILEQQDYSFDKASFGSYKDFVPNHYQFGYNFTAFLRSEYGTYIWDSALTNVAKKPYSVTPFNKALRNVTGKNKTDLFIDFKDSLFTYYKTQDNSAVYFDTSFYHSNTYSNYYSPISIDNEIFAIKTSLDDITRIVHISEQKEEIIHTPGFMNDYKIRGNEHYIVWTEQIPDVRWQNVNYSVIKLYNRKTGKVEQIGKKSRFYSPTINDKNLAFIEIRNTESVIFVYSLEEKTIIDSIKAEGIHFVDPQLINNDELVVILHENSGQSVALVNLKTHEIELLTENTFYEIKDPYIVDSTLYYISGENGTNNLYAISLKTKVKKQVTNVRYGIDGLSFSNQKLFFANYLSNGNNIGIIEVEKALE